MYRVSTAWIEEMIQEIEVQKEIKDVVWARLKKALPRSDEVKFSPQAKTTKHYEIYPTWEEAHKRLVDLATKRLFAVEKELRLAKYHLRQAQLLKQKSHFKGF